MARFVIPAHAVTHFHLRHGDVVADFGAGSGHFAFSIAHAVGNEGKVYAVEIQKDLLDRLAHDARARHLSNVHVVWGDLESPRGVRIGEGSLDAAVLSNTLFQIKDKERALGLVKRLLRRGGKFFIIDWTDSFGGLGPHPQDHVGEEQAKQLAVKAGFTFERTFPAGDYHYGLGFRA